MYFYLMTRRIISSTEDAVVAMTTKIKNMKVPDFEGEDITKVTGQLKMAIKRLEVLKKVPEDLEKNMISMIQNTSVPEFNTYFKQLGLSLKQIPLFTMTYNALLISENTQYREMLQIGTWLSVEPKKYKEATFTAEDDLNGSEKPPHSGGPPTKCRS